MMQETIQKIENRLAASEHLPPEKRAELLELVAQLKAEMAGLAHTQADDARSIAGFAAVSAHEATRVRIKPDLLKPSLQGLAQSVEGLEASHPRLVQVVNRICVTLANLGI